MKCLLLFCYYPPPLNLKNQCYLGRCKTYQPGVVFIGKDSLIVNIFPLMIVMVIPHSMISYTAIAIPSN